MVPPYQEPIILKKSFAGKSTIYIFATELRKKTNNKQNNKP